MNSNIVYIIFSDSTLDFKNECLTWLSKENGFKYKFKTESNHFRINIKTMKIYIEPNLFVLNIAKIKYFITNTDREFNKFKQYLVPMLLKHKLNRLIKLSKNE